MKRVHFSFQARSQADLSQDDRLMQTFHLPEDLSKQKDSLVRLQAGLKNRYGQISSLIYSINEVGSIDFVCLRSLYFVFRSTRDYKKNSPILLPHIHRLLTIHGQRLTMSEPPPLRCLFSSSLLFALKRKSLCTGIILTLSMQTEWQKL